MARAAVIVAAVIVAVGCFLGAFYVDQIWTAVVLIILGVAVPVRSARYLEGHGLWPSWVRATRRLFGRL